jgi:hypothetical protein
MGKSITTPLCRWMAAWVPYMIWNFYSVKNNKIANNSRTNEAREKNNKHQFGTCRILRIFLVVCLTKFKNNKKFTQYN